MDILKRLQGTSQWDGFCQEVYGKTKTVNESNYLKTRLSALLDDSISEVHDTSSEKIVVESVKKGKTLVDYNLHHSCETEGPENVGWLSDLEISSEVIENYLPIQTSSLYTLTPETLTEGRITHIRGHVGPSGMKRAYDDNSVRTMMEVTLDFLKGKKTVEVKIRNEDWRIPEILTYPFYFQVNQVIFDLYKNIGNRAFAELCRQREGLMMASKSSPTEGLRNEVTKLWDIIRKESVEKALNSEPEFISQIHCYRQEY